MYGKLTKLSVKVDDVPKSWEVRDRESTSDTPEFYDEADLGTIQFKAPDMN